MTDAPRISIVMPAYNASGTIAEAIQSVLRQTIRGLKLIVATMPRLMMLERYSAHDHLGFDTYE